MRSKHGDYVGGVPTKEWRSWAAMLRRCYNQNAIDYPYYGGRGITVCSAWRDSYPAFLADMGRAPGKGYTLDRIDGGAGYSPSNCRWATRAEQSRNRRMLSSNKSGVNGVSLRKNGSYRVRISANSRNINVGDFRTLGDAIAARKAAEQKHWHAKAG